MAKYKFNLGCGTDVRSGWINFDIVSQWPGTVRGADIIWDARKDRIPFDDDSAGIIYAGYLLMHLAPRYHKPVLAEIKRVLSQQDGLLIVGEVDMSITMNRFLLNPSDPRLCELIWGEQGSHLNGDFAEYDKHCHGFTYDSLIKLLSENGFSRFERINIHNPDVFYELTVSCKKS